MNYLISVENLKKLGLIQNNTDTKILSVAIKRSQDMHVQPALGTPLYKALLLRVQNNDWTNADYVTLMNEYVLPCLVAFVDYRAAVLLNEKLTNKAVGRSQDEYQNANTDDETTALRDLLRKDAYFYKERLIGHLQDDQGTKYPEYIEGCENLTCNENVEKDRTGYKPTGWII
jgi:hypothetical protein